MRVFAIGDLHLPGGQDKPMDIFGAHWEGHWGKIMKNWLKSVTQQDIVLIPGDISWAMTLEEALPDLDGIGALPGTKILIKGNHDYWWSSISRIRDQTHESIYPLQMIASIRRMHRDWLLWHQRLDYSWNQGVHRS